HLLDLESDAADLVLAQNLWCVLQLEGQVFGIPGDDGREFVWWNEPAWKRDDGVHPHRPARRAAQRASQPLRACFGLPGNTRIKTDTGKLDLCSIEHSLGVPVIQVVRFRSRL